jgi:hypothetical protein
MPEFKNLPDSEAMYAELLRLKTELKQKEEEIEEMKKLLSEKVTKIADLTTDLRNAQSKEADPELIKRCKLLGKLLGDEKYKFLSELSVSEIKELKAKNIVLKELKSLRLEKSELERKLEELRKSQSGNNSERLTEENKILKAEIVQLKKKLEERAENDPFMTRAGQPSNSAAQLNLPVEAEGPQDTSLVKGLVEKFESKKGPFGLVNINQLGGGSRKGRRRKTSKKIRKRGNNKSKKVNKGSGSKKSNKKNNVN